ncbi:MAG: methyl-accepting chemotaxis protein [Candidatus Uhrbacteria bacterium]
MSNGGQKQSRFGLTARFVAWFLFIALVPLAIIGYLSYNNAHTALEASAISELQAVNDGTAKHIVTYFDEQINSVVLMTGDSVLQNLVDIPAVQSYLERYVKADSAFSSAHIVDKDGKVLVATDKAEIGMDKTQDPYFVNAKTKPYIKDVYLSNTTNVIGFTVSAPLFSNENGQFNGVLVVRYKLDKLNSILATANSNGDTYKAHLVDSSGYVFTATRFGGEKDILTLKGDSETVKTAFSTGEDVVGPNVDYRNQRVLAVVCGDLFKTGIDKDWVLVTEVDMVEVDVPVVSLRNIILSIAGIIFLAVLLLAWYASRSLGEFVRRPIRNAVKQLTEAASVLAASTQQSSAASQQNSSTAQQLAAGATQQTRQSEEVSKNIGQMAAAIQQMAASSQEAAQTSSKTAEMAQKAGVAGESSQKSLSLIKSMVGETATMVKGIATSSEQIGEIVDTITTIAEQTNLLALNAAIEAARAGDAGRGFAVVADEVRKLAENSGKSAEEIKHRIKNVLGQVEQTVTAVESGVNTVDSSTKAVIETLQSLQSISAAIQQVSAKIQEVSAAIQQQSASVQIVAKNMDGIASVSEQNSSGAQQLSASTQQQSAANQQIAASTQQLMALGAELQKFVGGAVAQANQLASTVNQAVPVPVVKVAPVHHEVSKPVAVQDTEAAEETEEVVQPARVKKVVRRTPMSDAGVEADETKEV